MLYLFYSTDLLEVYENIRLRTSSTGFIDDINLLTYSKSTEQNCQNLESLLDVCAEWAKRHGSTFDPKKSHLIYFSRTPKRFNMKASLCLMNSQILPKD